TRHNGEAFFPSKNSGPASAAGEKHGTGVSVMTESNERKQMRIRQAVLERRTAELQRETEHLQGKHYLGAIRTHQERLKQREEELQGFEETLGALHDRFGALGRKDE